MNKPQFIIWVMSCCLAHMHDSRCLDFGPLCDHMFVQVPFCGVPRFISKTRTTGKTAEIPRPKNNRESTKFLLSNVLTCLWRKAFSTCMFIANIIVSF